MKSATGPGVLLALLLSGAIPAAPAAAESAAPDTGSPSVFGFDRAVAAPADLRGIYVYSGDVSTISAGYAEMVASSLKVPGADGIVLVIGWNALEPTMGQYQWARLDRGSARRSPRGRRST